MTTVIQPSFVVLYKYRENSRIETKIFGIRHIEAGAIVAVAVFFVDVPEVDDGTACFIAARRHDVVSPRHRRVVTLRHTRHLVFIGDV